MNFEITKVPVEGAKPSSTFRGKNRCQIYRQHELDLVRTKDKFYEFAAVCKDALKQFYSGKYESRDVLFDDIEAALSEYPLESMRIRRDMIRLMDYLDNLKLNIATTRFADGEIKAIISPDFYYMTSCKGCDCLHIVFIRTCKPDVKNKGRKLDGGSATAIELYLGVLYGRNLAKELGLDSSFGIRAEYIYSRSESDTSEGALNEFDSAKQITYLDDNSALDTMFEKVIEEFIYGIDECEGEACEYCPNAFACGYQKSPEPFEEREIKKEKKAPQYSDDQLKVINFKEGYSQVIAKAGSGKTTCVIERTARLLEDGADLKKIALLTFSEVGAETMKYRLCERVEGISFDDIKAMTFHTFCNNIIKENYSFWGFKKAPGVIDSNPTRKKQWLDQLIEEENLKTLPNQYFILDWAVAIHDAIKANEIEFKDAYRAISSKEVECYAMMIDKMKDTELSALIDIAEKYEERVKKEGYIAFDDMLPMTLEFLEKNPDYVNKMGYEHIVVDEAQDTDYKQIKLLKYLINANSFKSLMAVGDDSQSIYGWRGADMTCFLNFFNLLEVNGTTFRLADNHRSTKEILDLANAVDALNENRAGTDMVASRGSGVKPCIKGFWKKSEEVELTCDQIEKAIKSGKYTASDIAIISRTRDGLTAYAVELSRRGIPWISKYPMPLLDNSRVKAALSLAEAFYQPDAEDLYFNYVIAENDGDIFNDMTNEEIKIKINELKTLWNNMLYSDIEYQQHVFHDKLEAIKGDDELYAGFLELLYENEDFKEEIAYAHAFSKYGEDVCKKLVKNYEGVILTTAHSSKGEEYPICFVSLSKFDNKRLHHCDKENLEEVRRLIYVSLTRAKDILYVTSQYVAYGPFEEPTYNQFFEEVCRCAGKAYSTDRPAPKSKSGTKVKEMTKEEIAEYEKLTKNATQLSLVDMGA